MMANDLDLNTLRHLQITGSLISSCNTESKRLNCLNRPTINLFQINEVIKKVAKAEDLDLFCVSSKQKYDTGTSLK